MAFLYYLLHLPVLPAWALLIFAPQAALTRQYVHSGVIPLILGAAYAVLLFCGAVLGFSAPGAGMGSLAGVMALFSHPVGTLTGWAHFLVFDLFVGAWIARDAQALGLRHAGTVPVLLLALVFGPLGLFAHVLRRLWTGKGWQFG
ncbi:ABA4-like family protein [Pararhodobacter sp. CCB-MM2]|uniref:ABA4-like family protein n=1 Tax=Pararhodobacter sp. CCB-MM2 TaxID=1786003 RepID=UPI000831F872|nr:ABA4-like family protein [Pararhodobacter sp. CCB-MM2]